MTEDSDADGGSDAAELELDTTQPAGHAGDKRDRERTEASDLQDEQRTGKRLQSNAEADGNGCFVILDEGGSLVGGSR